MPDQHSKFEYERYYHLFNRGNNGEVIFKNNGNYLYFLEKWRKYIIPYADVLAYCLMPNHFHFLIKIHEEECLTSKSLTKPQRLGKANPKETETDINLILEDKFKRLLGYAHAYNKQQNRTGSLFQKRFKRIEINADDYLTKIIHYIHHNPIHHSFVTDYSNWRYSSYKSIISKRDTLINRGQVLDWFGGKEDFLKFHQLNLTRALDYRS